MICNNCKTKMTCGCQKRTATDGAAVCGNCVMAYENALKRQPNSQNINVTKVVYTPPKK
jgi:hypothetical protein